MNLRLTWNYVNCSFKVVVLLLLLEDGLGQEETEEEQINKFNKLLKEFGFSASIKQKLDQKNSGSVRFF